VRGLFIVSGPSGAGKSSLCGELIKVTKDVKLSVSHTTRAPRGNEVSGKEYYFVDKKAFKTMLDEGGLAEWTQIHGNYYGTSHKELNLIKSGDKDIILEIEGHGALQIKGQYPLAKTIFILTPDLETLRKRIMERGENEAGEIDSRMRNALAEIDYVEQFDYLVINDDFKTALSDLMTIIHANRQSRGFVWSKYSENFKR